MRSRSMEFNLVISNRNEETTARAYIQMISTYFDLMSHSIWLNTFENGKKPNGIQQQHRRNLFNWIASRSPKRNMKFKTVFERNPSPLTHNSSSNRCVRAYSVGPSVHLDCDELCLAGNATNVDVCPLAVELFSFFCVHIYALHHYSFCDSCLHTATQPNANRINIQLEHDRITFHLCSHLTMRINKKG